MKTSIILFPANSRGKANHGWLQSAHSFSFASYFDPAKMGFGALRVINDDWIAPGAGFGTHPHQDMEIITIPLSGSLKHRDSTGHESVLKSGDIQVMSAGTGITHSEYNASATEPLSLLQIWVIPAVVGQPPSYQERNFAPEESRNRLLTFASGFGEEGTMKILQKTALSRASLEESKELSYTLRDSRNGLFLFVIEGELSAAGHSLGKRDALGLAEAADLQITAHKNAELLLVEVPLA